MTIDACDLVHSSTESCCGAALQRDLRCLRVLLVEADSESVAAIAATFRKEGVQVFVAQRLEQARGVLQMQPLIDVVITELSLPDGRAESLLPDIELRPRQPAIIIASSALWDLQPQALEYRPVLVSKPFQALTLLRVVRTVARGYVGPVLGRFVRHFRFTRREAEATILVARGLKPKEAADQMCCREKVVYAHLARACRKAGCQDYHELVGMIVSFSCHVLGHTPPDHKAFGFQDGVGSAEDC